MSPEQLEALAQRLGDFVYLLRDDGEKDEAELVELAAVELRDIAATLGCRST